MRDLVNRIQGYRWVEESKESEILNALWVKPELVGLRIGPNDDLSFHFLEPQLFFQL